MAEKRLLILGKNGGGSGTQVQSDWAETNTESVSYIKNKPTISDAEIVIKQNNVTKGSFTLNQNGSATINLEGGGGGGSTQVQSDWAETNTESVSYIKNKPTLSIVATSGNYDDLLNKPTIPDAQVNSDWNANSGISQILNKPSLATVATTGSYSDLSNTPTIPAVNDATITFTQGGVSKGSITLNQSSDATIAFDAGGGGTNVYENQILLPLYFENISDNSIDLLLILDISSGIGDYYHDNASLEKSYDNINWESVVMPTKQSKTSRITIQPKSRVYFRGINANGFCYNWADTNYNHFCFDLDYKNDSNYVYVGGNLLSLIIGNDFLSVPVGDIYLESYSLSRLFKRGYQSISDSKLKHFEKMTIGLPFHGNYWLILASHTFDYICNTLNLSDESIYGYNNSTLVKDCAVGVANVIINNRLIKDNISTTNNVNIGISSLGVNSNYNNLYNKPAMTTETLTFVDANNVETTVVVYVQPTA